MSKKYTSLDTKLIHSGELEKRIEGAVSMPIFQSSTYEYNGQKGYDNLKYIRLNNTPNHSVLHKKLAALENAESGLVTSSGMSAITTSLLTVLKAGDHLLAQNTLYGGTLDFIINDLPNLGIEYDFIKGDEPQEWSEKLKKNTRAVFVETITNPLIDIPDLGTVVSFASAQGLISMIDNTFASPINFRPAELGFDLSLHSCSKYINGHSDIVAGAVIGSEKLINRIKHKLNHFGGSLDPHACFLLHRGLKTLALRIRQQNINALKIAEFMAGHSEVEKLNYPGLKSNPAYFKAKKYLDGFGGMLSFELKGGTDRADNFINSLIIPINAPSLGGVESLITRPVLTSHSGMNPTQRQNAGINDKLIRLSVGIEAVDDLLDDLSQALTHK
ncbi:MAG: aminotransferase class I/II-fold pyridoxal phosphate-dependent enzyme [Candidatus Neomarinimicrobiota bacterium]